MIEKIARKMNSEEKGFTLIELMVVVLIIGILIAIALPTFLGARQRAQNRAAQSGLRNGIAAAKTFFTDGDTYTGFTSGAAGTAHAIEPSLTFVASIAALTANNGGKQIAIVQANGTNLLLVALSDSGNYYGLSDQANGPGTGFCTQAAGTVPTWAVSTDCVASAWT